MRRRRLPTRRSGPGTSLVRAEHTSDYRYLEQVVTIGYPLRDARAYLARHMGNRLKVRLVEVQRGETVGTIRCVEVHHTNSGERTFVLGERQLPDGRPASFFVPDHLVRVVAQVVGAAAQSRSLAIEDDVILHVAVRGYMRFLPEIFQGEGPVRERLATQTRDSEVQRYLGQDMAEVQGHEIVRDEDPMRRFLFMFQHVMGSIVEKIEDLPELTDPLKCDASFLPWLASWVGFELDESLPVHQQRELVRRAIRLMRTRGTRHGIEEMVRVLTAAPARVEERVMPRPAVLGSMTIIGGRRVEERYDRDEPVGAYLMDPSQRRATSFFTLKLEPRERFRVRFGERARQVLRRIVHVVSQERPTHVGFVIRFDENG